MKKCEVQHGMADFDHEACKFFHDRCLERGIIPQPIPVSQKATVRRPDFKLSIDAEPSLSKSKQSKSRKMIASLRKKL